MNKSEVKGMFDMLDVILEEERYDLAKKFVKRTLVRLGEQKSDNRNVNFRVEMPQDITNVELLHKSKMDFKDSNDENTGE
jgi:hypothetical protein